MQQAKLFIAQKYWNLIFGITTTLRGDSTVVAVYATQVAFKNCAPFTKWITKTNGAAIDDAEDLDLVMAMHNLLE